MSFAAWLSAIAAVSAVAEVAVVSAGFFGLALPWAGEGFFVGFGLVGFFFFWPAGVPEELVLSCDPVPVEDQIHFRAFGILGPVLPEFFSAIKKGNER